jgi:REP element-mobilizing transposase RayT
VRSSQLALFKKAPIADAPSLEHGGDIRLGKRKIARPLDTSKPLHIVLRSSRAKRDWSLLRPAFAPQIRRRIKTLARRHGLALYGYANSGNHIHILGRARSREGFQSFLRVFAGVTARLVTGARRGRPVGRFWDRLAYSRIVSWGREYRAVGAYVRQNADEALGLRPYRRRGRRPPARKPRPPPPAAGPPPRARCTAGRLRAPCCC